MDKNVTSKPTVKAYTKEKHHRYPIVTIVERAPTNEHHQQTSRGNTSKALPKNPPSWFGQCRPALVHFVGPDRLTAPYEATVLFHITLLIGFTALLSLAARFPVRAARTAFICISSFGFVLLLGTFLLDLALQREFIARYGLVSDSHELSGKRTYRRNLGNTTLTVLLTIPFMTTLYCLIWFPNLNKTRLDVSSDTLVSGSKNVHRSIC